MAQIKTEDIVKAALSGVFRAQKDYSYWTGGEWLWTAPEYMTTVYIAKKIAQIDGPIYVSLENSAASALEDAGAKGQGRIHSKIRVNGRFDILVWSGGSDPRAVIEVKVQVAGISKIKSDLERICGVLRRKKGESTFKFGMVVFYTSTDGKDGQTAPEIIEGWLENIQKNAKYVVGEDFLLSFYNKPIQKEGESAWTAAALLVKRAPGSR